MEVVAVEDKENAELLDAVLLDTRHPGRGLVQWWGGYASQSLARNLQPGDVAQSRGWRSLTMELATDWQEGHLRASAGEVEFVYGEPLPEATRS
jgi:hypothetical protein